MTGLDLPLHSLLLGGITGYLIGSIPFAYLITRSQTGMDLRVLGTGNIGTANAFEVTGKKSVGVSVLVGDVLKGVIPVVVFSLLGLSQELLILVPALILGHCYPVWLRFHGGRGLATAAGAAGVLCPSFVIAWGLLYLVSRRVRDHVHFGAIVATGGTLALVLLLPMSWIERSILDYTGLAGSGPQVTLAIALVLLVILSRHIEPFIRLIKERV